MTNPDDIPRPLTVDFVVNKQAARPNEPITFAAQTTGGTGNLSYYWEMGEGADLSYDVAAIQPTVSYTTSGNKTITLVVTDETGSVTKTKTNFVYISPSTLLPLQAKIGGCIGRAQVNGRIQFTDFSTGGYGAPYNSYLWDFGDGTTSTERNPDHAYTQLGQYTVTLTVCDGTGCSTATNQNCVDINIGPGALNPDFLINGQSFTSGQQPIVVGTNTPVTFTSATSAVLLGSLNYQWDFDYYGTVGNTANPRTAYTNNPQTYYTSPGTRSIWMQVAYSNTELNIPPRSLLKTTAIQVVDGLGATGCYANIGNVTLSTTCWKEGANPTFNVPVSANCRITTLVYDAAGNQLPIRNGACYIAQQPNSFPYTYTYTVKAQHWDGKKFTTLDSRDVTFTLYDGITANSGGDRTVCQGNSIQLAATQQAGMLYQWSSPDAEAMAYLGQTETPSPVFTASKAGTYTYTLTVTNPQGGCSASSEMKVTVYSPVTLAITPMAAVPVNTPVTLAAVASGGSGNYTYSWEPSTYLDSPTAANPVLTTPVTDATLTYTCTVTDAKRCGEATSQVSIPVNRAIPTNLTAKVMVYNHIQLTWTDNATNETAYVVERTKGTTVETLATLPANTNRYDDICIPVSARFRYRVAAVQPNGERVYSNEASALTPNQVEIVKEWNKSFTNSGDNRLSTVIQTPDKGFVLAGISNANAGGAKSENSKGGFDFWVIRTDAQGNKIWDKTYGGTGNEYASLVPALKTIKYVQIIQTPDGGYLLAGTTRSDASGDVSEPSLGGADYWILKIDANGTKQWDKRYGTPNDDRLGDLLPTSDGNYIISGPLGLIKIQPNGEKIWQQDVLAYSLQPTKDGGFIGISSGTLMKVDDLGRVLWRKPIDFPNRLFYRIFQTSDGGFMILDSGAKFVKFSSEGVFLWDSENNTFADTDGNWVQSYSASQTKDGGYMIACHGNFPDPSSGTTQSFYGLHRTVIKIDANGNRIWHTYMMDILTPQDLGAIFQTSDNEYLVMNGGTAFASTQNSYNIVKITTRDLYPASLATHALATSSIQVGSTVAVPFSTCSLESGNTFTAQLSDASGSFANPVTIGTLQASSSGVIQATIPATASTGDSYRIRVVSSSPVLTGTDNGTNLTLSGPCLSQFQIVATDVTVCHGSTTTLQALSTQTCTTGGLILDGSNDEVQVGDVAVLKMENTFTLEAWVQPTGTGSLPYGGTILGREGEYLLARWPDGSLQYALANTSPGWSWINTGYIIPANVWSHVALTYNNGVIVTYVNGTIVHTYTGSGDIGDVLPAQNDFRIGGRQWGQQNFQGNIDEVRIWNYARSISEIRATMRGSLASITPGLVASWTFEQTGSQTASNTITGGAIGTLRNGATQQAGTGTALIEAPHSSTSPAEGVLLGSPDAEIQVGAVNALKLRTTFTLEAWVYPDYPSGNYRTIVSKEREYILGLSGSNVIQCAFFGYTWSNWIKPNYSLLPNQWSHIALTYNNGNITIYVNGKAIYETYFWASTGVSLSSPNDFRIGSRQGQGGVGDTEYFEGAIDEVMVWGSVRTEQEIRRDMQTAPSSANNPSLLAYWPLDNTGSLTATNLAAGGATGILRNGATQKALDKSPLRWSPTTGLNVSIGSKVQARPAETTTYTVTNGQESASVTVHVEKPTLGIAPDVIPVLPGQQASLNVQHSLPCEQSLYLANDYMHVTVPESPVLNITNNFTLEALVYPTTTNPLFNSMNILGKAGEFAIARSKQGYLQWAFANSSNNLTFVTTSAFLPVNTWSHICIVFEAGSVKTYLNGVLTHTAPSFGIIWDKQPDDNRLTIGYLSLEWNQPGYYSFNGYIDEVRIWNTVRSAADIQKNAFLYLPSNSPNLIGYWNFNGNTADATANSNHGRLYSGAALANKGMEVKLQWSPAVTQVSPLLAKVSPTQLTTYTVTDGVRQAYATVYPVAEATGGRNTDVSGAETGSRVLFYPNPFADKATLFVKSDTETSVSLTLTDLQGRLIYTANQQPTNTPIEIGEKVPVGMYIIRAVYGTHTDYLKIIKLSHP